MLEIGMEFRKGLLFIRLRGTLDADSSYELSNCMDQMIYEKGVKYFVINLEELDSIDNEGIKILENRYYDVILHDGKLVICGYNNIFDSYSLENKFLCQVDKSNTELGAFQLISL